MTPERGNNAAADLTRILPNITTFMQLYQREEALSEDEQKAQSGSLVDRLLFRADLPELKKILMPACFP